MKRCPKCEFIYEDEQSLCDMDGVLLVLDSRTLPHLHALQTVPETPKTPPKRNRAVPAFATLILAIVLGMVYYVSIQRRATQTADIPVQPIAATASNPVPEVKPTTEAQPAAEEPKPEEPAKKAVTSLNLAIKLALMADPQLFPLDIEVEMDKGKAILSGSVPTEEDKAKVAEIAGKIDGVETVINKLTVTPALKDKLAKKQDESIAHVVRDRLSRSETLKAVGFDVKSENGIVYLSGKTRFQVIALEAAEAARQVPGVRAVDTAGVQLVAKE